MIIGTRNKACWCIAAGRYSRISPSPTQEVASNNYRIVLSELVYYWATPLGRPSFCNWRVQPSSERLHNQNRRYAFKWADGTQTGQLPMVMWSLQHVVCSSPQFNGNHNITVDLGQSSAYHAGTNSARYNLPTGVRNLSTFWSSVM